MTTATRKIAALPEWYVCLPVEPMSQKTLDALPEYSLSDPTGTVVGKVWKRDINWHKNYPGAPYFGPDPVWLICEYVSHPDSTKVGIDYRRPQVKP